MIIIPEREEAKAYAGAYRRVPVAAVVEMGEMDPTDCFLKCKKISKQCFILESMEDENDTGRYTFIGYDPKLELTCKDGLLLIRGEAEFEIETENPIQYIRKVIADNSAPTFSKLPPFTGGLAGYFSYDYIKYSEPSIKFPDNDPAGFRDVDLMLFDKLIAFDRLEKNIYLIVNIKTDAFEENYSRAVVELGHMREMVFDGERAEPAKLKITSEMRPEFGKELYCDMVRRVKRHIVEGDIFQAVISNRLDCDAEGSLFETYRSMRKDNPSPYMFYFSSDDLEIAGSAPETLVKLRGRTVSTFPLAGTRKRGETPEEDAALEKELLSDSKELAEHNMLVDLGRNDIGRISRFGSVRVDSYLETVRFSHVMHIGSAVSGELREDMDAVSAITSLLPAGTLSGAPKIRACQIISDTEGDRRGIYGGAIGYIAFNGDMDTCIAIRIAYKKNGKVYIRSGAGIVADSNPENEYEECGRKLASVISALKKEAE